MTVLSFGNRNACTNAFIIEESCHSAFGFRFPQHQAGNPVPAARFPFSYKAFLFNRRIYISQYLAHFIADLRPGCVGDCKNRIIQQFCVLRNIEKSLFVLSDFRIYRFLDANRTILSDCNGCSSITLGICVCLDVWHAAVRKSIDTPMLMPAGHQIHILRAQRFCHRDRIAMAQDNGDIRFLSLVDLFYPSRK